MPGQIKEAQTQTSDETEEVSSAVVEETSPELSEGSSEETPEEIAEESSEESSTEPVSYSDFLKIKGGADPVELKKKVKETAQKVEDEEVESEIKPASAKTAAGKPVAGKDFTGIDEADKPLFVQMSNETFARQKAIYLENRDLKQQIETLKKAPAAAPNYYAGHPEAYTLTPEYRETATQINTASVAEDFLVTQLENIAQGNKFQGLTVDEKGNLYRTAEQEPSERARITLERQLREIQVARQSLEQKRQSFSTDYNKQYESDLELLKSAEQKYFPDYDKEDHPTRKAQDAFINTVLPATQRNNPLAKTLAKTVANNALFANRIKERDAKIKELEAKLKNGSKTNQQQVARGKTVGSSASVNTANKVSYTEFKRMREAGVV